MKYANTDHINFRQAFKNKTIAKSTLKQFVDAHRNKLIELGYFDQKWQNETFDDNFFTKAKGRKTMFLEQKLVSLYENRIIPSLKDKIIKEIKKLIQNWKGRRADMNISSAAERVLSDVEKGLSEGELRSIIEKCLKCSWWRKSEYAKRLDERKRISYASQIITGRSEIETAEYHGFSTTTGQGEDKDEDVELEEEYCYICEKIISKSDKVEKIQGSDFVSCSNHCYNLYNSNRDNHGDFRQCSSCIRQIPKSIGTTCKTCQNNAEDEPLHTCPQCQQRKAQSDKWTQWKSSDPSVCSQGCLFEWAKEKLRLNPKRCDKCKKVKRTWEGWKEGWEKANSKFYCSEECKNNRSKNSQDDNNGTCEKCDYCGTRKNRGEFTWTSEGKFCSINCHLDNLKKQRNSYLRALQNIDGWNTELTEEERKKYVDKIIHGYTKFELDNIINEVSTTIAFKKNEKDGNDGNGQDNLIKAKNQAIVEIDEKLLKEPKITNEELEEINQNWGLNIQNATKLEKINQIKSRVLADIESKRLSKQTEVELDILLKQAKKQTTYETLAEIINKIKQFRNDRVYQKYRSEIEQEEARLQNLDPIRYKEEIRDYFNEFLKNNDLTEEELNQETKQVIDEAIADPSKKYQAEEAICQNGADNKLDKLYQKIEVKIKQGNLTKKERKRFINEIQTFISKNNYQETAYEKNQQKMDALINQLVDSEKQDEEQSFLPKWFWPVTIVSFSGIAIIGIILWIKNRKINKGGKLNYN